jgi:starvation-inducible DNA-binding protein
MNTDIGLHTTNAENITQWLEGLLADEYVLLIKTRNFHWNVRGINFSPLHALFEEQYSALSGYVDEIAERIKMLGFAAPGSMAEFLKNTQLKEVAKNNLTATEMLQHLLTDHETIIKSIRAAIPNINDRWGDAGTADFITGIMQEHEKMAWMLRASLQ